MANKRDELISCAIRCVSRYGLEGTRTQQITDMAGLSQAALYTHFGGKDEILQVCFETVDQQIAELFRDLRLSEEEICAAPKSVVYLLWSRYFRWLTTHPDETRFYYAYRMTPFFAEYDKERKAPWFQDFAGIFNTFDRHYHIYQRVTPEILWTHILTVSQLYAKLVLDGVLNDDEATAREIFRIQMAGINELLDGDALQ